jgi:hypothetical protein
MIKSRRMRWEGHVAFLQELKNSDKILVGKLVGKSPFGRLRCKWKDNIKIDLKEMGLEGVDSSGSGFGPVAESCEHGHEPSGSIKCAGFLDQLSDY